MLSFVKRMWAAAPVATIILAVALAASGYFGVKATASWVYWNNPAHIDQPIMGWMTPRYVAHSWNVPRHVMVEALQLDEHQGRARNLTHLAQARGVPLEDLIGQIEDAVATHRQSRRENGAGQ